MKKTFNLIAFAIAIFICLYNSSCKNGLDYSPDTYFVWTLNGVTDTASLDFAALHSMGTAGESKIIAGTGVSVYYTDRVWISLPSLNVGTYALGAGGADSLKYFEDTDTLNATAGSVIITGNKGYLTGSFSGTMTNSTGGTKSISGSFSNIELDP